MAEVIKGGGEVVVEGEEVSSTHPLPVQAITGMRVEDMNEILTLLRSIESHLSSITELTFEGN